MVYFIYKANVHEKIPEPVNTKKHIYFSTLFDSSSNAKTMDEKEVYVIKSCDMRKPCYNVLALQQAAEADAQGLHNSLKAAVAKVEFNFDRTMRLIGLGSNGTNTNKALYCLEKKKVGDHLILVLCISHKLELALKDSFKPCKLDDVAENQLNSTYYFFEKANLKWQLFKKYCLVNGKKYYCYKRAGGTRWVSHQLIAIDVYLKNLPMSIGFLNSEISSPCNATMKKEKPRMES